ncbi:anthranilate phosphoribosyltransferase [Streptomyces sp. DT24]|uniref:anthranilate phosphoribosyltransferase n=1 Tax=unclassified Streptomyces TaxID=2593676 RepID=UPI0023B91D67|nr:anthranilate phosphoribosyltransferase [Streptomyces sp. AM 4-1-1]WEH33223.1 anthranilate phosphoribosyltransferase [Streptomyces sp. AM 4-1-1]
MEQYKALLSKTASGGTLTREESSHVISKMVTGEATPAQMGALLMALRVRGETVEELTGAALTLRSHMLRVDVPPGAVDVVGTGGDEAGSYNISTCAAFIVAGSGVPVAKHGNRALSSRSGAADVLSALGVRNGLTPAGVEHCVRTAGIGFMFAPAHHPALKHVAPTRKELATRTLFNLLGPLLNPAGVRHHLVGVFSRQWLEPMARVLRELGSERALVVHGSDGLDEMTTGGPTLVCELNEGTVSTYRIAPEDVGLPRSRPGDLRGGDPAENAKALTAVLEGERNAYRDVAVLNAAGALVAAGAADGLAEGVRMAQTSIDSGQARHRLDLLAVSSHESGE